MCQPIEQIKFKICSKCKTKKPASEFHKHKGHTDGLSSECKGCKIAYRKGYYGENSEAILERQRAHNKTHYKKIAKPF